MYVCVCVCVSNVSHAGVRVLIEPTAIMKILVSVARRVRRERERERLAHSIFLTYSQNSTMDYVEDDDGLREEFVFENPQVKGTCGCGESWHT